VLKTFGDIPASLRCNSSNKREVFSIKVLLSETRAVLAKARFLFSGRIKKMPVKIRERMIGFFIDVDAKI
jgi:hypothetical protein